MTHANQNASKLTLCDADAAVLDALLEARARGVSAGCEPMPPGSAGRAERMAGLLRVLAGDRPAGAATEAHLDDLTAQVMAVVADRRLRRAFVDPAEIAGIGSGGGAVAWRQVLTAAAVFVVGLSLLLPVLSNNRSRVQQTVCASGLSDLGAGFARYAADHRGRLPRYEVAPQTPWWRVGQADSAASVQSNSANLFLLAREGYVDPGQMNCVANEHAPADGTLTRDDLDYASHEQVSYSYQNQFRVEPIRLGDVADLALLADKNPLFVIGSDGFRFSAEATANAPSTVHAGRGQNVLLANGEVRWAVRPTLHRGGGTDNIWTAHGIDTYQGDETPSDAGDSFLVP